MTDTIILVENRKSVSDVFSRNITNNFDILDRKDLLEQKICTKKVRYVLSTWYFPELSDLEIESYLPKLKYVFYAGGDTSYFASSIENKGIKIFNAKSVNGKSVADFVLGQILLANKGYYKAQANYKKTFLKLNIKAAQNIVNGHTGNYNVKIGLLGFGSIPKQLTEMLNMFGFEIYAYDPFVNDTEFKKYNVKKSGINEIFETCNIISNHLPDVKETRNIINYKKMKLMLPNATLINTGRGRQIDEIHLLKYCLKNKNFTCLLDVTSHEPLLPMHPLYFLKNVFITPHIAGSQSNEKIRMGDYIYNLYLNTRKGVSHECSI